ncbi:MAG: hypothetical protein HY320_04575 [Armatimonadetes bacterium]|nr:hypothetical protein [Armatimonadota bacterium]
MSTLALLGGIAALFGEGTPLTLGLAVVFGLGLLLGCAGVARRSWGMLLAGLLVTAFPMGFAAAVYAVGTLP